MGGPGPRQTVYNVCTSVDRTALPEVLKAIRIGRKGSDGDDFPEEQERREGRRSFRKDKKLFSNRYLS